MNANSFRLLKSDIRTELKNLSALKEELDSMKKVIKEYPSHVELRAMGSILHDFYSGIEKIFQRIAISLDGEIPKDADWHTRLIFRMASEVEEIRPAVISGKLQLQLKDYLRFRHLFRNLYGFELEWEKIQTLVQALPEVHDIFDSEISVFLKFIDSLTKNN